MPESLLQAYADHFGRLAAEAGGSLRVEGRSFIFTDRDESQAFAIFDGSRYTPLFDACARITDTMHARLEARREDALTTKAAGGVA